MRLYRHPEVVVGQWLQEANESVEHKDVHLVCDDGILAWSGLLLSTGKAPALAEGIRTLNRCSFCVEPIVVILTNTR